MNKREKNLSIATGAIAVLGCLAWLASGGEQPRRPPTGSPSNENTATAASKSSVAPESPASAVVCAVTLEAVDLAKLIAQLPHEGLAFPEVDPFRELPDAIETGAPHGSGSSRGQGNQTDAPSAPEASAAEALRLGGVFVSGETKGALINDEVCFEGDSIGEYTLVRVEAEQVILRHQNRNLVLPLATVTPPSRP